MTALEWDEVKRQGNLVKHGVDFVDAYEILADPLHIMLPDDRRDYGESRFIILGVNKAGRVCVLIVSPRMDRLRVISLRLANDKERKLYAQGKNDKGRSA